MTTRDPEAARARAEATFRKKEEAKAAAQVVMAEIEARQAVTQMKTERLRALRLEKEAADKAKAAEVQAMAKPKGRRRDAHAPVRRGTTAGGGNPSR